MKKLLLLIPMMYAGACCAQNYIDNYLSGTPTYTTIASSANSISLPRDLDFKPNSNELWIANKGGTGGSSMVIIYNAGQSNQSSQFRKDSHSGHFMIYGSAIAFGDNGDWGSTGEIKNTASAASTFMGPALWSGDTSIFARVFQNNWVNGKPLGSHLDMIHQSPFAMGIAHDSANMYWVFDGHNSNLCKYDFGGDHSPGYDDHSNAKIWRYTDIPLTRQVNISSHMVKDKSTGWLYIIDGGTQKVKRVNTRSGAITGTLSVPGTSNEPLAGYWRVTGAQHETLDSFPSSQPAGIDVFNGRLIVSDFNTGDIHVYNIAGTTPVKLGTIATAQPGIMSVKIGPDGKIWFANYNANTVVRINPSTVPNNDAAIDQITAPVLNTTKTDFYNAGFNQCANTVTPIVSLRNTGANALSSATITYQIDNGTPATYSWTGTLAAAASVSVTLPAITAADGNHKLSVSVSNPNGTTDANPANDRKEGAFRTRSTVVTYPFSETFSSATFPPSGWNYLSFNFNNPMSHEPSVGGFGSNTGSVKMDNLSSQEDISGQKDYLMLPRINMTGAGANAGLSFSVAYARRNVASNDALAVMASTDCGITWTELFQKSGSDLETAPATPSAFTPSATEWRKEIVPLTSYTSQTDLMLMFVATSNHGNNVYIDDVNIAAALAVEQISKDQVSILPNPTTGQISVTLTNLPQTATVHVFDIIGREITSISNNATGKLTLDLTDQPAGMYVLKVIAGTRQYQQKISVIR